MKNGVMLINSARGGIVDEQALCDALKSGKVAAAAFDVFAQEPPKDCPLLELDNFIATPHLGAATQEAQDNVAIAVSEQIVDYLVNDTIRNAVNFPSVSADTLPSIKPFVNLAERIGGFLSQNFDSAIDQVVIEYMGGVAELLLEPIKIAVLKGILAPILEETVNFINAPLIAHERGIQVKEMTSEDAGDYHSMLVVTIKSGSKTSRLSGVLHGKKEPRIVSINGFAVEVVPEGHMLVVINKRLHPLSVLIHLHQKRSCQQFKNFPM
jgi:D-3-phosphoglycerate dehydrogenase